ncbi:MAG TPA: hypothetical protein VFQ61_34665 [Polyangiaceae bacterium]|nr:hypothetical protein [Polyangiaceae bacterium]
MFTKLRVTASLLSGVVFLGSVSATAFAQGAGENVATPPPAVSGSEAMPADPAAVAPAPTSIGSSVSTEPVIDTATTRKTFPNRPLLVTSFVLLGGTYAASAIVGKLSDRDADKKLYYPVVGPWLDLNHRGCDVEACSSNTRDRVLLAADGVLQGIGAFGILLSMVVPEKTTRNWYLIGNNSFTLAPQLGTGRSGLVAVGSF